MSEKSRPKLSHVLKPYPLCCPRCGSLKVKPEYTTSGWLTPPIYLCENCGYHGSIFLEVKIEDLKYG